MQAIKPLAFLAAALSLTSACTESPEPPGDVLQLLEERLGPPRQSFTIDGRDGGPIRGESISFVIPPGAVVDPSGRPVTGPIDLELREFDSVGDMVRGGRPTVTRDGLLLASSGSFDLDAVDQRGQPVEILELEKVAFRNWQPARQRDDMELWLAGKGAGGKGDNGWVRPNPEPIRAQASDSSYYFDSMPFGSIGGSNAANCDRLWQLGSDHMTLKVQLGSEFVANAGVFFLPTGSPVAAKLYTKDLSLPGFVSYDNMMPVGVVGKLVVVSLIDDQYYLYHDDAYVIPTGTVVVGGKEETIHITPLAVSEADFMAYMAGL